MSGNTTSNINTEGKNIANSLYNASIITVSAVEFVHIGKQIPGGIAPRLDLIRKDLLKKTLDNCHSK